MRTKKTKRRKVLFFKRGLSLVEILITVTIIALLVAVGYSLYTNAAGFGNDARRKLDVKNISDAYEQNYQKDNKYNPLSGSEFGEKTLPKDPVRGNYYNVMASDGSGYKVCASLEKNPSQFCNTNSTTCYCLRSANSTITETSSISGSGSGAGLGFPSAPSCDQTGDTLNGLVGYWKFDESTWKQGCNYWTGLPPSGDLIKDYSGNNNPGQVCVNDFVTGEKDTLPVQGKFGNAAKINFNYIYIDHPANSLKISGPLTLSGWAKYKNPMTWALHPIIMRGWNIDFTYTLGISNSDSQPEGVLVPEFTLQDNTWDNSVGDWTYYVLHGNTPIQPDMWYHFAGVYEPGKYMKVYLNGVKDAEKTSNIPTSLRVNDNDPIEIGNTASDSSPSIGDLIDDVRVYNRALSDSEIRAVYNEGNGCIP